MICVVIFDAGTAAIVIFDAGGIGFVIFAADVVVGIVMFTEGVSAVVMFGADNCIVIFGDGVIPCATSDCIVMFDVVAFGAFCGIEMFGIVTFVTFCWTGIVPFSNDVYFGERVAFDIRDACCDVIFGDGVGCDCACCNVMFDIIVG